MYAFNYVMGVGDGGFGLSDRLGYTELSLDSLDASNTKGAGVSKSDWPEFRLNTLSNVAGIKIIEAQIPFSFYVINGGNNTFLLSESSSGNDPQLVALPIGNYDYTTISEALGAALTTASLGLASSTYTVDYLQNTQKLLITKSGTGTFTLAFGENGDPGNTNPRLWLGFNDGAITSGALTMTAPNVLQITGPNYLYINSDAIGTLCGMFLPKGATNLAQNGIGPQLAKIPITVGPGGVIFWQDPGFID